MRRLVVVALAALGLTAAPSAATAQLSAVYAGEGRILSVTEIPVRASGALSVTWSSDPATCAAVGRCGLDGTVTWTVPRGGSIAVIEQLVDGRRRRDALLSLRDPVATGVSLRARVRRATADGTRICTDAAEGASFMQLTADRGRVGFGLGEPGNEQLIATRCAGPAMEDVEAALPVLRVPLSRLTRGRTRLRLAGEGTFVAAGLRGLAASSLGLRLGRPRSERYAGGDRRPTTGRRYRTLEVRYRIAEVRGDVGVDLAGATEPAECGLLDACGVTGTLRLTPALTEGELFVTAEAPASRGSRALQAAVGLAPGPAAPGVEVFGGGYLEGPGRSDVSLARPEGGPPCTDSAPLESAAVMLQPRGDRLRVTFEPGLVRTRCPGPVAGYFTEAGAGELPRSAFAAPRVELRLDAPTTFTDQGWTATSRPALTVVLERVSVRERVRRRGY